MLSVPLAPGNISDVNARAVPLQPPFPMLNDDALAGDTLSGALALQACLLGLTLQGLQSLTQALKSPRRINLHHISVLELRLPGL